MRATDRCSIAIDCIGLPLIATDRRSMRVHRLDAEAPCTFAFALVPFGADHPIFGADDPKFGTSSLALRGAHLAAALRRPSV